MGGMQTYAVELDPLDVLSYLGGFRGGAGGQGPTDIVLGLVPFDLTRSLFAGDS